MSPKSLRTQMPIEALSEYELQRKCNIEENNRRLVELGIDKRPPVAKRPPAAKKLRTSGDPEWKPERRTTRVSKGPTAMVDKGDSSGEEGDSSEEEYENIPKPRLARPKATEAETLQKGTEAKPLPASGDVIVIEAAKTGRSKCRRCMDQLVKGEMRVGMESWMVGRAVLVWHHPRCFIEGVAVVTDPSGRGKCKQTKAPFAVGEHKITCTVHTTTSHLKLRAAAPQLQAVLALIPELALDDIEGFGLLSAGEAAAAAEVQKLDATLAGAVVRETTRDEASEDSTLPGKRPEKGSVARATGKVCWRFAGHLCYGALLPGQESKTHCYARTHKGNTKTLTKGSSSWWLL